MVFIAGLVLAHIKDKNKKQKTKSKKQKNLLCPEQAVLLENYRSLPVLVSFLKRKVSRFGWVQNRIENNDLDRVEESYLQDRVMAQRESRERVMLKVILWTKFLVSNLWQHWNESCRVVVSWLIIGFYILCLAAIICVIFLSLMHFLLAKENFYTSIKKKKNSQTEQIFVTIYSQHKTSKKIWVAGYTYRIIKYFS